MNGGHWRWGLRRDEGPAQFALRLSFVAIGLGAAVFGVLAYVDLLSEIPNSELAISQAEFGLIAGLPVLVGIAAFFAPSGLLRIGGAIYSQLYLIALLIFAVAGHPGIDPHGEIWLTSITTIPAVSLMAARPRPTTWLYVPVVGALTAAVAIRASSSPRAVPEGLLNGMYAMTFTAIFVGFIFVSLQWTQLLDSRLAADALAQAEAAAQQARSHEHERFRAMVHDSVISTLLMAGRAAAPADVLAGHAQQTLEQLHERDAPSRRSSSELFEELGALLTRLAPEARRRIDSAVDHDLPGDVADALLGASAEAIRNAVQHGTGREQAGAPDMTVVMSSSAEQVSIEIRDTGIGFDVALVPANRMGIHRSIVERSIAAGVSAAITSSPGDGTTVVLRWQP
ncbi:MAG: sensor histidine kinase [Microbacteriaceae bacterium]